VSPRTPSEIASIFLTLTAPTSLLLTPTSGKGFCVFNAYASCVGCCDGCCDGYCDECYDGCDEAFAEEDGSEGGDDGPVAEAEDRIDPAAAAEEDRGSEGEGDGDQIE